VAIAEEIFKSIGQRSRS